MATATRFTLPCQLLLLLIAVAAVVAAASVVIVYPFCHIYLVGLEAAVVGEGEAKGVRDAGPVISIYNLILSNDNDDDNNSSSSNLQPATCNNNNNESSAAAIKTLPLQSPDKLVLMAPAEPSQGPQQRRSPDLHSLLSSLQQSAVCDLSRLRFGLHSELGLGLVLGLRFSLWLRYCKPRTERQSS